MNEFMFNLHFLRSEMLLREYDPISGISHIITEFSILSNVA